MGTEITGSSSIAQQISVSTVKNSTPECMAKQSGRRTKGAVKERNQKKEGIKEEKIWNYNSEPRYLYLCYRI